MAPCPVTSGSAEDFLSSLQVPFTYWKAATRSPRSVLFSLNNPSSFNLPSQEGCPNVFVALLDLPPYRSVLVWKRAGLCTHQRHLPWGRPGGNPSLPFTRCLCLSQNGATTLHWCWWAKPSAIGIYETTCTWVHGWVESYPCSVCCLAAKGPFICSGNLWGIRTRAKSISSSEAILIWAQARRVSLHCITLFFHAVYVLLLNCYCFQLWPSFQWKVLSVGLCPSSCSEIRVPSTTLVSYCMTTKKHFLSFSELG